jgi:hypothetical protein
MRRRLILILSLLLVSGAAAAGFFRGGLQPSSVATITSVTVTPGNFLGGSADGTSAGAIAVNLSMGSFTGTIAIGSGGQGTDFRLSSTTPPANLLLNGTQAAGSYTANIVPTQAGLGNSGTAFPVTITGTAGQTIASITPTSCSFTSGAQNGAVCNLAVTMSPTSPASTAALSLTGANSGGFHLSGAGCSNISLGTCTIEQSTAAGGTPSGNYSDVSAVATQGVFVGLPAGRDASTNWRTAGLQSIAGIPARNTQCGSTVNPIGSGSDDTAAINSAISSCTAGDFVNLGSGTFTIAEGHFPTINKGITVRGQGAGVTILNRPTGVGTWQTNNATFSGSISGTTLTIDASPTPFGTIVCGGAHPSFIGGGGVTAGTTCSAIISGSGAAGTYTVNHSQTVADEALTGTQCDQSQAWGATIGCGIPGNNATPVVLLGKGLPTASATTTLAANGNHGATTIQLTSTTGFQVGGLAHIDQLAFGQNTSDPAFNSGTGHVWMAADASVTWNDHNPAVSFYDSSCLGYGLEAGVACSPNLFASAPAGGDECAYSIRCGGVQEEDHLITAIGAGPCPGAACTITFDSPLMNTYTTANSAGAVSWQTTAFAQQAGLENLTVQNGDNNNVEVQGCVYCWSTGVEDTNWLGHGFSLDQAAFRFELDNFWSHNAAWPSPGGGGYSIALTFGVSECLIQNGISMLANKVMVVRASGAGCVAAYNYMDDSYIFYDLQWQEIGMNASHLAGSQFMLFEGNYSVNYDEDSTHGSVGHHTLLRNYATGYRAPFTAITGASVDDKANVPGGNAVKRCFAANMYTGWMSYIGNICGSSASDSNTWTLSSNLGGSNPIVFSYGWNPTSVGGSGPDNVVGTVYPGTPTGTYAASCLTDADPCTTISTGNYEYHPNGTIHWDTRGPMTIPNSFYLGSKPSFFGANAWPPIDPTGPTVGVIPAQARWAACVAAGTITAHCIFNLP